MVRATIACVRCRRSKIKCVHDGAPPCRNCVKSKREPNTCVISEPMLAPRKARDSETAAELQENVGSQSKDRIGAVGSIPIESNKAQLGEKIRSTPVATIMLCATTFSKKFPELSFLHLPTLSRSLSNGDSNNSHQWAHISAMLSLSYQLLPSDTIGLLGQEEYTSLAQSALLCSLLDEPNIEMIQAALMMAMKEWGSGKGHSAWMYSGMATRMMQSLEVIRHNETHSITNEEIYNRTYWACFVMDRLVFCGKSHASMLPMIRISVPLPVGEQEFAFGTVAQARCNTSDTNYESIGSQAQESINNYYSVLIRGFNIWAETLTFINDGGRRQPAMTLHKNCPWMAGSPWKTIYDDLEAWRSKQSDQLRYPDTSVAIPFSLGRGESFVVLFLTREYIPFLPSPESVPGGPADPPYLEAPAPPNWWVDRSRDLFNAAACITQMLSELSAVGSSLITPFAGFCVFSAATMNTYATAFPHMNPLGNRNTSELAKINIQYLEEMKIYWKMGKGWSRIITHLQKLYPESEDIQLKYHGRTRDDFLALEASVHDSSGVSPFHDNAIREIDRLEDTEHAAAVGLQSLASAHLHDIQSTQESQASLVPGNDLIDSDFWSSDTWTMWGEQQFLPFATVTVPDDFTVDI